MKLMSRMKTVPTINGIAASTMSSIGGTQRMQAEPMA